MRIFRMRIIDMDIERQPVPVYLTLNGQFVDSG